MSRQDPSRPELPWLEPGDGGTTVLFLVLVLVIVAVGVSLFVGIGLLFPSLTP